MHTKQLYNFIMKKSYFLYFKIALLSILLALTFTNPFIIHADNDVIDFNWPSDDVKIYTATEQEYKPTPNKDHIELAYIESTGTQCIDTRIKATELYELELDVTPKAIQSSVSIFKKYLSSTLDNFTISTFHTTTGLYLRNRGVEKFTHDSGKVSNNERHLISIHNNVMKVDDDVFSNNVVTPLGTDNYNVYLLSTKDQAYKLEAQVQGLKMWGATQELVRDFIPVLTLVDLDAEYNIDNITPINKNKVCLYDRVSGKYFLNSGTGEFIASPPVKTFPDGNEYGLLECIISNGSQSIDTGIKGNEIYEFELDINPMPKKSGTSGIFKSYISSATDNFTVGTFTNQTGLYLRNRTLERFATNSGVITTNERHNVSIFGNEMKIDTTVVSNAVTTPLGTDTSNVFLLGTPDLAAGRFLEAKVYSLKIWGASNQLLRNYIPVIRCLDNKAGMYDLENDRFYPCANSSNNFSYETSTDFYSLKEDNTITYKATDRGEYTSTIELTKFGELYFDDTNLSHSWIIENNKFISPVHDYVGTYNGKEHTVSIDSTINNQIGDDITTNTKILFSDDNGLTYTLANPPKYKKVGTYTVYYKITPINDPDKYDVLESTAKVIIRKAKITIPRTGVK